MFWPIWPSSGCYKNNRETPKVIYDWDLKSAHIPCYTQLHNKVALGTKPVKIVYIRFLKKILEQYTWNNGLNDILKHEGRVHTFWGDCFYISVFGGPSFECSYVLKWLKFRWVTNLSNEWLNLNITRIYEAHCTYSWFIPGIIRNTFNVYFIDLWDTLNAMLKVDMAYLFLMKPEGLQTTCGMTYRWHTATNIFCITTHRSIAINMWLEIHVFSLIKLCHHVTLSKRWKVRSWYCGTKTVPST
jgi:hypothetical protein